MPEKMLDQRLFLRKRNSGVGMGVGERILNYIAVENQKSHFGLGWPDL
jgi:hypothetical protein